MLHVHGIMEVITLSIMLDLNLYGWKHSADKKLEVVWDVEENISKVNERLRYTLSGCKCKTGCGTKRCKCKKLGKLCGPGCKCSSCINTSSNPPRKEADDLREIELEELENDQSEEEMVEDSEDDLEVDEETNDIMQMVFGDWEDWG